MKFRWEHDKDHDDEVNLHDLDRGHHATLNVVGWVQPNLDGPDNPKEYQMRFVWADYDEREERNYATKREAMRALRTAYRMHIIGGGALRPRTT